jgi:uncharacterized protein YbaR (Trm112 family)
MKLIVCESCESEFRINHSMDSKFYKIIYCPFCRENVEDPELVDEMDDIGWNEKGDEW